MMPAPQRDAVAATQLKWATRSQPSRIRPSGPAKSRKARSSAGVNPGPPRLFTSWATPRTSSCRPRIGTHKMLRTPEPRSPPERLTISPRSAARSAGSGRLPFGLPAAIAVCSCPFAKGQHARALRRQQICDPSEDSLQKVSEQDLSRTAPPHVQGVQKLFELRCHHSKQFQKLLFIHAAQQNLNMVQVGHARQRSQQMAGVRRSHSSERSQPSVLQQHGTIGDVENAVVVCDH
jgi:hypothetical protein